MAQTTQTELQQRASELEAKALELERTQESLQNALKDTTAELRDEVGRMHCMMPSVIQHLSSVCGCIKACLNRPRCYQRVILGDLYGSTWCYTAVLLSMQSTASLLSDRGVPQSLLRMAEQAAKCEALTQMDALREDAAAAAEDKRLADAALTETRDHLHAASAQVCDK